jgi:hypothetical protein
MLLELISEIENGGTLETSQLAHKLNTTPEMISALLDHLRRSGLLKTYETCGDGCAGCSLGSLCDYKNGQGAAQIWEYEEKGK